MEDKTVKRKRKTKKERNFEQVKVIKVDPNSLEWKEKIQNLEKRCKENQGIHEVNLKNSVKNIKKK